MLSEQILVTPLNGAIQLVEHPSSSGVPTRYLQPGRAETFALTQPLIIDKTYVFERIADEIISRPTRLSDPIHILDIGSGPSFILDHLIAHPALSKRTVLYTGVDLSSEMSRAAAERVAPILPPTYSATFHSGVNVPVEGLTRVVGTDHSSAFDLILSLQFSHYFPTTSDSPLGEQFKQRDISPLCKADFWNLCRDNLRNGGSYIDFDDVLGTSADETKAMEAEWDRYALQRLVDPNNLKHIRSKNAAVYQSIATRYVDGASYEVALDRLAQARTLRRTSDREEVATAQFITQQLASIFGDVTVHQHPHLKKFNLFITRRNASHRAAWQVAGLKGHA